MRSLPLSALVTAASLVGIAGACGGRTPLPWPEAAAEASPDARPPESGLAPRCVSALPVGGDRGAAYVELVLDGSGSMDSDNKWTAASQALAAIFDDLALRADPLLAVGLLIFEDENDPTHGEGPYPSRIDVPPAVVDQAQRARLTTRLANTTPAGGTPTLRALEGAYAMLEAFTPVAPVPVGGRRVVVLLSDGVPNDGVIEQAACVKLVGSRNAGPTPIRTFAVGIGPFPGSAFSYDPAFMGSIAVAGGTATSPTCRADTTNVRDVCHFQVTPNGRPVVEIARDFIGVINQIRGTLRPACDFTLVGDVGRARLDGTSVSWFEGGTTPRPVPRNESEGWTFDDDRRPTRLTIRGDTCARILADAASYVEVKFVCN